MTKSWRLPTVILVATLVVMTLVATIVIPTRGPLHWDEATHALKGLEIAHDLRQGDLISFAYNSYRQVLYPPLYSWFLALGLLGFGATAVTVSWISLLFFGLGAGLMWLAGEQLDFQRPNLTGAIAAILWLTSPPLLVYATQGMLEIPGLIMLSLTLVVALKLLHNDQPAGSSPPREWMLLGLMVALTYLMRIQYGVIIGLTLALTLLIHISGRVWRAQIFYALLPTVLILGFWFAYIPKIPATWQWLVNVPAGVDDPYSVEGWLYYPLAMVRNSGSLWLFGLFVVTFLWVLIKRQSSSVNLLAILIILLFTFGMFHHNKQSRYLFPMLPAFFLLAGYGVAEYWRWAQALGGLWRSIGIAGAVLLLVQAGFLLQSTIKSGTGIGLDPITDYIVESINESASTLVIGSMMMTIPGAPLLDWQLSTEAGLLAPPQAGAVAQVEEGRRLGSIVARLPLPAWLAHPLTRAMTGYDQRAPLHTLYVGLPLRATYSQGVQGYATFVSDLLAAQAIDQVVVIYRTDGTPPYGQEFMTTPMVDNSWSMVEAEDFAGQAMRVEIWRR